MTGFITNGEDLLPQPKRRPYAFRLRDGEHGTYLSDATIAASAFAELAQMYGDRLVAVGSAISDGVAAVPGVRAG